MTTRAPRGEARAGVLGGMQEQGSEPQRTEPQQECYLRFELRGRLHACLQELDLPTVDYDVVGTILEGAVEAIEAST